MVNDPKRPVQFVFAGKAHPNDEPGKRVLQQIAEIDAHSAVRRQVRVCEDYDINVGRHNGAGVDVWLNNPRVHWRPRARAAKRYVNGGLNLSVLDGWWAEATTA